MKLGTLSKEKPHNRNSPERSRTQPEYLSINKCTSWYLPLIISIYEICTISRYSKDNAGAATTMPGFIPDLNKSNDDKFLYLDGSALQSWAAL